MNQLDVLESSVKSLNQGSLFFASLTAPIIRRDLTMNEKFKSELKEAMKKYAPAILVGIGPAMVASSMLASTRAKTMREEIVLRDQIVETQNELERYRNRIVEQYSVDEYIEKYHRIPVSEEERKYCNWMTYEKETSIYEAYEEFKSMEDFG